jgi:hypothetical protein
MMHGIRGYKNYPDDSLFTVCVDKGVFLMEE